MTGEERADERRHRGRREVEPLLVDFEPAGQPVRAVWPPSRLAPGATRLLVESLAERLSVEDLSAPAPRAMDGR